MSRIGTFEWLLDRARDFIDRHSSWVGVSGAYLLGLLVNALYDPTLLTPNDIFQRLYNVQAKPLNWFSWIATSIFVAFPTAKIALGRYFRKQNYAIRLAEIYSNKVDGFLRPFQRGRLAWGPELVLQTCPDLHAGWPLSEVQIKYVSTRYSLPSELHAAYERYIEENISSGRFQNDKIRLMLTRNPIAFSDSPTLMLDLQETTYSEVLFFKENISVLSDKRAHYINQAIDGTIGFPNSFCLHMAVVTSDGYLLLTQRSDKVDYFRDAWSCSAEEQLDLADLRGPEEKYAKNWGERLLWEELGVGPDGYDPTNLRAFAVFLEGDVLNCGVAGIAILRHDRNTLDAIIDKHPRTDYEFQKWDFISWKDVPRELSSPSRPYHPSSGLRLFFAGIYKYGVPGLGRQLYAHER